MKFASTLATLLKPPTARRHRVPLSLIDGQDVPGGVALVPLQFEQEADALARAEAYAAGKGIKDPKPGHPVYDRGVQLYTLLAACLDPDSTEEAPELFFGDEKEIRTCLDPDRVNLLFQQQRAWQNECAPSSKGMSSLEFFEHLSQMAKAAAASEVAEIPFDYLPYATRQSFLRQLVSMLCDPQQYKLLLGLLSLVESGRPTSESSATSTTPEPPAAAETPTPPEGAA